MEKRTDKICSFTDLDSWKQAHQLVLFIYKYSKKFPEEEKFGLSSQIRRAVVSITSNIAEGFSRRSYKEKIQFYYLSQGSNTEVQNQIIIAKDLEHISDKEYQKIVNQIIRVHKLINGMIRKCREIHLRNT